MRKFLLAFHTSLKRGGHDSRQRLSLGKLPSMGVALRGNVNNLMSTHGWSPNKQPRFLTASGRVTAASASRTVSVWKILHATQMFVMKYRQPILFTITKSLILLPQEENMLWKAVQKE
ncbi:hypothetical protein J6590_035210 [Homalodisca vitripennis]|nr:hypothetical protein J6590_035210 [Homalodisca vitripennis]